MAALIEVSSSILVSNPLSRFKRQAWRPRPCDSLPPSSRSKTAAEENHQTEKREEGKRRIPGRQADVFEARPDHKENVIRLQDEQHADKPVPENQFNPLVYIRKQKTTKDYKKSKRYASDEKLKFRELFRK